VLAVVIIPPAFGWASPSDADELAASQNGTTAARPAGVLRQHHRLDPRFDRHRIPAGAPGRGTDHADHGVAINVLAVGLVSWRLFTDGGGRLARVSGRRSCSARWP